MIFSIPILVEEQPAREMRLASFIVRPLFHAEPVQRADKLSRALNKLTNDLHERLSNLGREPRHDLLAEWAFNPELEETSLEIRLELDSGSRKCRFFFAGYAALGRKLYFTPAAPELHFEVLAAQSLMERATVVLTRHFREREKQGAFDLDVATTGSRMRLTSLEITLQPAALAKAPEKPARALIFGGMEKKDGEQELRKTGRPLHLQYPDDLDRAVDREHEVEELARLFASSDRRPIVMIGPRKAGKTTIIHELVWRICARKKERYGGGREVWLLSPLRLISGMSYPGEWENRMLAILDYVRLRNKVLYFDDLLGLFTAGISSASDLNVAAVLKPALEKRHVRVLAEITPEAWRILRERDRGFADLFHVVPVNETSEAETFRVLVSVARQLEEQHRCEFSLAVVPAVYDLYRRFGGDSAFPGKAAGFLRRLAVRFAGSGVSDSEALNEFQEQSGLHAAFLNDRIEVDRKKIVEGLRVGVVGQDHALNVFADVLVKLKARLHDPRRPLGTFLLLGPTGVGKTQAAKSLATYLFSREDRLLRFDMNEYLDAAAASRLTGTPREPEGLITSAIRRQPFSVVLFDEIEKAAPEVFDLLLAVLDEGRLTDALGRVADFTHSIIVLTSNLGAREAGAKLGFGAGTAADEDAVYLGAAEKFFRPEFFNRLDHVIPFRPLTPAELESIARKLIASVFAREGMRRRECLLNVLPAAMTRLVDLGHHPRLGARALKRVIEREVAQPMAQRLAALPPGAPTVASFDAANERFVLRLEELRPVARSVFWGDSVAQPRAKAAHREWVGHVLDGVHTFLDRVEEDLEASAPSGRIEIGTIRPEQARYFFCREQFKKVERIALAAARAVETPQRSTRTAHLPKARPTKIVVRQFLTSTPRFDREREAIALRLDLTELEAGEPVEVPDSPMAALLRETALLEAMFAEPVDDRPAALVMRAMSELDAEALSGLARIYQDGIAGLWGGSAEFLFQQKSPGEPPRRRSFRQPPKLAAGESRVREQAIWCEGLNLKRLLPADPRSVLVRRRDGTLGVILVSLRHPNSGEEMRALLKNEAEHSAAGAGDVGSFGPAIHMFVVNKTVTDFRDGLEVPADPSPEEARAFLLSALPLPAALSL